MQLYVAYNIETKSILTIGNFSAFLVFKSIKEALKHCPDCAIYKYNLPFRLKLAHNETESEVADSYYLNDKQQEALVEGILNR